VSPEPTMPPAFPGLVSGPADRQERRARAPAAGLFGARCRGRSPTARR